MQDRGDTSSDRPDDDFKSDSHRSNVGAAPPPAASTQTSTAAPERAASAQSASGAAPKDTPSNAASTDARATDSDQKPSLFERLFRTRRARRSAESDETDLDAAEGEQGAETNADGSATGNDQPAKKLELTEEELERRVQAEADRREAVRKRRETVQATQQQVAALERKRDEAVDEGDADAAREAKDELARITSAQQRQQALGNLLTQTITHHDSSTLDVLRDALPEKERAQLLTDLAEKDPLEGRKHFTESALKVLERHWKAEGAKAERSRLEKNPAEKKRVVLASRDDEEDPDDSALVGASAGGASPDMDTLLRQAYANARGGGTNPLRITADD